MAYEINVSQNGEHLFATHPRSLPGPFEASEVYAVLQAKFLARDGYKITVSRKNEIGVEIEPRFDNASGTWQMVNPKE
jgi:hypothetical protein